ncbi:Lysosome-associated membrane glycoprotein 1 [Branchiostoma belcheri]|nr:Lysosome-associated membrane glycoprotein 1 [Branchiostoma belcheri]
MVVTGTCAEHGRNVAFMNIDDNHELGMKLTFTRNETLPHRIYFLSQFEVWYVYTQNRFPNARADLYGTQGSESVSNIEWFQAPEEYSYLCRSEQRRTLVKDVDIVITDVHIQPFEVKHNDFSGPMECAMDSTPVPPTTRPPATLKPVPPPGHFNLTDKATGDACVLLQVGAQFSIDYETESKGTQRATFYLPSDATPTGTCGQNSTEISLAFAENCSIGATFDIKDGAFTVTQLRMMYVERPPLFPGANVTNETRSFTYDLMAGPLADLGDSYRCNSEQAFPFSSAANLTIYDLKIQPFQVVNDTFGEETVCEFDVTTTPGPTTTPEQTTTPQETTTPEPSTTPGPTTTPEPTTPGNTTTPNVTTTPLPENSTTTPYTPTPPPAEGKWHVTGGDGKPCLLADSEIQLQLKYNVSKQETKTATFFVPTNATASGSCEEMSSSLQLEFQPGNFSLQLGFAKTQPPPNNSKFVLKSLRLRYQEDPTIFDGTITPDKTVDLEKGFLNLFETEVGKSYRCESKVEVKINKSAEILFRFTKIQPFGVEGGKFGEESVCSEDVPTIPPGTATTKPAPTSQPQHGGNGGAIAAGILVPLVVIIIGIAGYMYYRRRRGLGAAPYKSL